MQTFLGAVKGVGVMLFVAFLLVGSLWLGLHHVTFIGEKFKGRTGSLLAYLALIIIFGGGLALAVISSIQCPISPLHQ